MEDLTVEHVDIISGHLKAEGVQVILRAVDILWALRACPEGQTVPQLARASGLARPTAHRIVNTLESVGFVALAGDGRVRLGPALAILGAAAKTELSAEVHPYLQTLSQTVNESVMLAVLQGDRLMCVDFIASPQSLQAIARTGTPLPFYCTAIGKALLPDLAAEEFARLVPERPSRFTGNTLTSREAILMEARQVEQVGFALDREEYEMGLCGLGTSISQSSRARASIGILVPSVRFYGNEERLICELIKTRDLVRSRLGAI